MAFKIMLDAGHRVHRDAYGKATGQNVSPIYPAYVEAEKIWLLQGFLKKELEQYGCIVGTTRTKEDEWLDKAKTPKNGTDAYLRGIKADSYDLFISLHSNAVWDAGKTALHPVNVNYAKVERVVIFKPVDGSGGPLAEKLAPVISGTMGIKSNYQITTRRSSDGMGEYYAVLNGASITDCPEYYIIEHGFHTNEKTAKWLYSNDNLKILAEAEAAVIAKHYGLSKPAPKPLPGWSSFPDVPKDAWYAKAIEELKNEGIVQGYPDGTVKPEQYAKRSEMFTVEAKILAKCKQLIIDELKK